MTAGFWRPAWQHERFAVVPAGAHGTVMFMALQQECCPVVCMASRQAVAGIAVQRTTTASMNSALFLPQVIVSRFRVSIVSIHCRAFYGGDLDHTREAPKNNRTDLNIPKPPAEHERIARFYEAKARDYRAQEQEHEAMVAA